MPVYVWVERRTEQSTCRVVLLTQGASNKVNENQKLPNYYKQAYIHR